MYCLLVTLYSFVVFFFFSSRRRHTRSLRDWSSDVYSSDLDLVRRLGADVAINHNDKDWIEQVKEANGGQGTDIILEMIGGKQAEQCLQCLAPFGRMVIYGRVSGQNAQFSES